VPEPGGEKPTKSPLDAEIILDISDALKEESDILALVSGVCAFLPVVERWKAKSGGGTVHVIAPDKDASLELGIVASVFKPREQGRRPYRQEGGENRRSRWPERF